MGNVLYFIIRSFIEPAKYCFSLSQSSHIPHFVIGTVITNNDFTFIYIVCIQYIINVPLLYYSTYIYFPNLEVMFLPVSRIIGLSKVMYLLYIIYNIHCVFHQLLIQVS